MTFYHEMNGVKPAVFIVLPMLGKHPDEYPRFRDCFVCSEDHPEYDHHIHVYTRTGGGNRQAYAKENKKMTEHENYVDNFDDSFDPTYATFVFSVPKKWAQDYLKIRDGGATEISEEYKAELYRVFPKLKEKFDQLFKQQEIKS